MLTKIGECIIYGNGFLMKKLKFIFLIVGLFFLALTAYLSFSTIQFQKTAQRTEGTVVKLHERISTKDKKREVMYYPEFAFLDGNKQLHLIESSKGSHPPAYDIGEKVSIIYQPDEPDNAKADTFVELWLAPVIMLILGVTFTLPGLIMFLIPVLSGNKAEKLQRTGLSVKAKIIRVEQNEAITMNGRSPWRIVCQWHNQLENRVYVFNSQNFWFDPQDYIKSDELTVFIDKSNPKKYWVDTRMIPSKA